MKKLDCTCTHTLFDHVLGCQVCSCEVYDPAGHNPELENILCSRCRLVRMERSDDGIYYCPVCSFILFEKQVLELVG